MKARRAKKSKCLGLIGASGRMGVEIVSLLEEKKIPWLALSREDLNSTHSYALGGLIDFSTASAVPKVVTFARRRKLPVVSGTTGPGIEKVYRRLGQEVPVLWSANMSLGVAVLKASLEALRKLESQTDFDYQVEEFHHNRKLDSPSGTALALQSKLGSVLTPQQKKNLHEPVAMRLGGIYGVHKVHAVSNEEWLCFEHQALSRRVFAQGAITAALWLLQKKRGFYTLEDLLES